jgi:DNA polymerase III beta subunit, central domain
MENQNTNPNHSAAEIAAAASAGCAFPLSVCFIGKEFLPAIKALIPCASKDENRFILNGLYFDVKAADQVCNIVATDGRRLAAVKLPISTDNPDFSFIVSAGDVKLWLKDKTLKRLDLVKVLFNDYMRRGRLLGTELSFKAIEGNYPNYRQVIPKFQNSNVGRLQLDSICQALEIREAALKEGAEACAANDSRLQSVKDQSALFEKEKGKVIRRYMNEANETNHFRNVQFQIIDDFSQGKIALSRDCKFDGKFPRFDIPKEAPRVSLDATFLSDFVSFCEVLQIKNSLEFCLKYESTERGDFINNPLLLNLDFLNKSRTGFLYIIMPMRI